MVAALGFVYWINTVRAARVTYISGLTQTASLTTDATSPTGYAGGLRNLIVPEHNNESYQWIVQTQLLFATKEWRLRHVNYDNAPTGRDIHSASPYRWWLGLITWSDHKLTGRSIGLAAEHAALYADPLLQGSLLIITAIFTAWRFGAIAAALLTLGFATLFPFAGSFLPGQPADHGLAQLWVLWSILLLLAGMNERPPGENRRWFFLAGLAGGIGLWVSVQRETPILLGLAFGGMVAAWFARTTSNRTSPAGEPAPWRAWAIGGAIATTAAWLVEFAPKHLDLAAWRLEVIHPLYALAWLGGGELLARATIRLQRGKSTRTRRDLFISGAALVALLALPVAMVVEKNPGWLTSDALASRLTNLSSTATADNLFRWFQRDGATLHLVATCLPLTLVAIALWFVLRRDTGKHSRSALAVALGPLVIALGFACAQLRWWNIFDSALLALIAVTTAAIYHTKPIKTLAWIWTAAVVLVFVSGALALWPKNSAGTDNAVTEIEIQSLIERDLSHWLANRVGSNGAVVVAPPDLTTSLYFHGGLRGIATPDPTNKDGFAAAVRISAASSADEAQALIRKREVTHVIMPSWDTFLDEYARLGSNQPEHTLVGLLHQWLPPRWLRPVPYHLPEIAGFEGQSVALFELTDVQDNTTALSHLAEYFAEMGLAQQAIAVSNTLDQSFATDLSSLIAQAQVAMALKNGPGFQRKLNALVPHLAEDEAQGLAWNRRVSLAIVLAEGKQYEPAREQVERCLAELDEPLMRSLSSVNLYRLQVLAKAFKLEIAEPSLRILAGDLLPAEMRAAL